MRQLIIESTAGVSGCLAEVGAAYSQAARMAAVAAAQWCLAEAWCELPLLSHPAPLLSRPAPSGLVSWLGSGTAPSLRALGYLWHAPTGRPMSLCASPSTGPLHHPCYHTSTQCVCGMLPTRPFYHHHHPHTPPSPPPNPNPTLPAGERLVREQDMVNALKLSDEYLKKQRKIGRSMLGLKG